MKLLIVIIFISFLTNMSHSQNDMQKLYWLADRWVSIDGESTSYEHWEKAGETLLIGGSETIKGADTVFAEKLRIELIGGDIFYIADVPHNPAPVNFRLTYLTESEAVFENPNHDFPQKITYKNADGVLNASIEGPGKDKQWKKIDFMMNKMR